MGSDSGREGLSVCFKCPPILSIPFILSKRQASSWREHADARCSCRSSRPCSTEVLQRHGRGGGAVLDSKF